MTAGGGRLLFRSDLTPLMSCRRSSSTSLKGNSGRAAVLRLQRQVGALGAASAVVVWILWILRPNFLVDLHPLLQHEMLQQEEPVDDERHAPLHRRPKHGNPNSNPTNSLLRPHQHSAKVLDESDPTTDPAWQDILQARLHLVDLKIVPSEHQKEDYDGIYAVFCKLDWNLHKNDPSTYPMFRDLIANSPECEHTQVKVPFRLLIDRIRSYDATAPTHLLQLGGVVFHESRCGSTLVANLLASMTPAHRVYSESGPPVTAMMLGCAGRSLEECNDRLAVQLLRDTVYLMQRSNQSTETHVFFKIQSVGTLHLDTFLEAFPETPWFFVYRAPVEVMVSHLQGSLGKKASIQNANCVRRQRTNPPEQVLDILERVRHTRNAVEVNPVDYCAAHLASITESALKGLHSHPHTGRAVNYQRLPEALWEDLIPHHLHLPVSPIALQNMQTTSGQYSKGRQTKKGEFQGDSEHKEAIASPSLKRAAQQILESSFEELETF